jgi:polysaccharide pyruvyl transferase WcaK-like protein
MLRSVTLLGSSSGRNAGDAALISGIMDAVDSACGTRLLYEIPTLKPSFIRNNYPNRTRPISVYPWQLSLRMLGLPTYRSVRRTDLSLIFDAILFDRALFNPFFNFLSSLYLILPAAKRKGRKLGMYNVGIGPVTTDLGRKMLRDLADLMDFITVRDKESYKILKNDFGVRNPRLLLTADAALNVCHASEQRVGEVLQSIGLGDSEKILAVNINRYLNTWAQPAGKALEKEFFLTTYAAALNRVASETDASMLFVATQHNDLALTRELMGRVNRARRKAFLNNVEFNHHEIAGVLSHVEMLFAMRLHCMILCSSSMTPVLGMAYQPKVQYYVDELGIPDGCLGFDRFSEEAIYAHVMKGWENRGAIRALLEKRIPVMKKEALKAAQCVAAIHQGEDMDSALNRLAAVPA